MRVFFLQKTYLRRFGAPGASLEDEIATLRDVECEVDAPL
jgi:hypothetical protein